jgi:hypothetical protein
VLASAVLLFLVMAGRIGLLTTGGYILFAIVVGVIKLVQVATAH